MDVLPGSESTVKADEITWAPELVDLAEQWQLYDSTCRNTGSPQEPIRVQPCVRCTQCDCVVYFGQGFPPDTQLVLVHLSSHHGYRMDGTRDPDSAALDNPAIEKGTD